MTKSYFERFFEWQNYAHYVLLFLGLLVWMSVLHDYQWYKILIAIFVVDSIVHGLFWNLPKPFQWRD